VLLEQRQGGVDLAPGARRDAAEQRARERRRLVGVVGGQHHGRDRRQALDEPQDGQRRAQAAREDDARGRGQGARGVGGEDAEQDVRAVAGGDDHHVVQQPVQEVRQRHRRHDHPERLAAQERAVARDDLPVARLGDVAERRGGEQPDVGQRVGRDPVAGPEALLHRAELPGGDAVGHGGRHLAARRADDATATSTGGLDLVGRPVAP
jgi:hypothetical protein